MREIKFRAWDMHREGMFGWDSYEIQNNVLKNLNNVSLVFMQYTGLKDKNGKEIYEGDIVRLHCFNENLIIATIKWLGNGSAEFYPCIHNKKIKVKGGTSDGKMVSMGEVHSWAGEHSCFSFKRYLEV